MVVKEATGTSIVMHLHPLMTKLPDLHHHLGDLLDSQFGADVTFEVNGEQLRAHRIMLAARSPVLRAELFGHMKEKHMDYIQIDDMDATVFRAMLHFIYTDSLPEMNERDKVAMAQHLIDAADRYDLERRGILSLQFGCQKRRNYNSAGGTAWFGRA